MASLVAQRAALARQRSSSSASDADVEEHEYSSWGMDDDLCSVCANPVDRPGSLYCSADCLREDERLTASTSLLNGKATIAPLIPANLEASSSIASASKATDNAAAPALASLRYTAFPSPSLNATLISSADRARPQQSAQALPSMSPLTLSSNLMSPGAGEPDLSGFHNGVIHRRKAQSGGRRRPSPSSSHRSSSPSDPDSCDPTTPSPQVWATSAPQAQMAGEPSALRLPPSIESENAIQGLGSLAQNHGIKGGSSAGTIIGSLPTPPTEGMLKYSRRASHTAQPAPVLFRSPVIQATRSVAPSGRHSTSNTPAVIAEDAKSKASGSGSETSDLDLRDNESSAGSSAFSLDRSKDQLSPRAPSTHAFGRTSPRAVQHQRMPSDSAFSSSRRSPKSPFLHATMARPSVAHAATAPAAQAIFSTSSAWQPEMKPMEPEVEAPAPVAASPPRKEQPQLPPQRESGRGRSHARGPRSSSRRRSPSPPRRGDRRSSRDPSGTSPPSAPSIPLSTDDDEAELLAESIDERPRGRQGHRNGSALLSRAAGSLTRYTICEQAFPAYGHEPADY